MQPRREKPYGMFGWKEFRLNRKDILYALDRSKEYNSSRPVSTEHGNAAESELRSWLSGYLPKRFGVTSGYVIPDRIVDSYKLYHFDVIIYDAFASPVLWVDGNRDDAIQGRKQAIPARHVLSVWEVKASLTPESAKEAIKKLGQLDSFTTYLPSAFSCSTFFFDLDVSQVERQKILLNLLPSAPIKGYWGGLILRCLEDQEMTGIIEIFRKPANQSSANEDPCIPLAKNLASLKIEREPSGNVVLREPGAGVTAFSDGDAWHFAKIYGPTVCDALFELHLNWSYSGFASFALELLSRLDGVAPNEDTRYAFGRSFDL